MTKEELEKLKQTVDYFGHWYDVIGEERIVILEKSIDYIDTLEQDKCELLGIIQAKDKVIKNLKEENDELKDEIESNRDLPTIAYMQGAEKQKKKDEALLTKAKNLLRELYVKARYSPFSMGEHKNILTEVLEFLQEE